MEWFITIRTMKMRFESLLPKFADNLYNLILCFWMQYMCYAIKVYCAISCLFFFVWLSNYFQGECCAKSEEILKLRRYLYWGRECSVQMKQVDIVFILFSMYTRDVENSSKPCQLVDGSFYLRFTNTDTKLTFALWFLQNVWTKLLSNARYEIMILYFFSHFQ